MNKHHDLKTEQPFFDLVKSGVKPFEIRNDDRAFRIGDTVTLKECNNGIVTGHEHGPLEIDFILDSGLAENFGLKVGHVIFTWRDPSALVPRSQVGYEAEIRRMGDNIFSILIEKNKLQNKIKDLELKLLEVNK